MNKSLMISIQPQHAVNILNGDKTLELRTWIPKGYVGWVYVYVTKGKPYLMSIFNEWELTKYKIDMSKSKNVFNGNGKVAFRFWFDEYNTLPFIAWYYGIEPHWLPWYLQLSIEEINTYGKGKDLYAWHIKKLEVFDEPKELSYFYTLKEQVYDELIGSSYRWYTEVVEIPLTKAPQRSVWVYTNE